MCDICEFRWHSAWRTAFGIQTNYIHAQLRVAAFEDLIHKVAFGIVLVTPYTANFRLVMQLRVATFGDLLNFSDRVVAGIVFWDVCERLDSGRWLAEPFEVS